MVVKGFLTAAFYAVASFVPSQASRTAFGLSQTSKILADGIIVNNSIVPDAEHVVLGFSSNNLNITTPRTSFPLSRRGRGAGTGTSHEGASFNEHDMLEAMRCLHERLCKPGGKKALPGLNQASCTVNGAMAYICNYQDHMNPGWQFFGGRDHQPCDFDEMKQAWEELKNDDSNPHRHGLGWWHEWSWKKTYGWDLGGSDVCPNMPDRHWHFRMDCNGCRCRYLDRWGSPVGQ